MVFFPFLSMFSPKPLPTLFPFPSPFVLPFDILSLFFCIPSTFSLYYLATEVVLLITPNQPLLYHLSFLTFAFSCMRSNVSEQVSIRAGKMSRAEQANELTVQANKEMKHCRPDYQLI